MYVYASARMYVPLMMCVRALALRSHHCIFEVSSRLFYGGALEECGDKAQINSLLSYHPLPQDRPFPVLFIGTYENFTFTSHLLCFVLFCLSMLSCICGCWTVTVIDKHNSALTLIETSSCERGLQKNKCALLLYCCYICSHNS